jgi:hypothetical protein
LWFISTTMRVYITPTEARKLAAALVELADHADDAR